MELLFLFDIFCACLNFRILSVKRDIVNLLENAWNPQSLLVI